MRWSEVECQAHHCNVHRFDRLELTAALEQQSERQDDYFCGRLGSHPKTRWREQQGSVPRRGSLLRRKAVDGVYHLLSASSGFG